MRQFIITGEDVQISDGYHTMKDLYRHRLALFIALCKAKRQLNDASIIGMQDCDVWRSKKHSDGTMFDGDYFILGINREKGKQISYHLSLDKWELTNFADTLEFAPEWDGHTSEDVIKRLFEL